MKGSFRRTLLAVAVALGWALVGTLDADRAEAQTLIRIGTVAPEGSRFTKDLRAMTQEIERLSGGQVTFKWYTGARLGGEKALFHAYSWELPNQPNLRVRQLQVVLVHAGTLFTITCSSLEQDWDSVEAAFEMTLAGFAWV